MEESNIFTLCTSFVRVTPQRVTLIIPVKKNLMSSHLNFTYKGSLLWRKTQLHSFNPICWGHPSLGHPIGSNFLLEK